MKKLLKFLLGGGMLLLPAVLAAQNTIDVLDNGPQPADAPMKAVWSSTSNANPTPADITSPIIGHFVFVPDGAALPTDVPAAVNGQICLVDTAQTPAPTLFAQMAANCKAQGAVAVLLFDLSSENINAAATIPVFAISGLDGKFLENTVGSNPVTLLSNDRIRINVAAAPPNQAHQHNCPVSQATATWIGPGTSTYTPNESLCTPGSGEEPSIVVDGQGTIYIESIRGVPGGLDLWRWNQAADGPPNPDGTLPFKYEGQPDGCGITPFVSQACTTAGVAPGGGDGDLAFGAPDPTNNNVPNLAVVSLSGAEVTASHSTDHGDTYSTINPAVATIPGDDRMWIGSFDDPTHVYIEYHDAGTAQIISQRSRDGGETYIDAQGDVVSPTLEPSVAGGNWTGRPAVDRSQCGSRGNVYQLFAGPNNPTDNSKNSSAYFNTIYLGVASPSLTNPVISYTDYQVFTCGAGSTCPGGAGLGNIFPTVAVDQVGNVYAAWSDNNSIYYSYSRNHGQSWSAAMTVNQGATVGKVNLFSWIAADANGHVAIAWFGGDQAGNSNTVPSNTHWNVYVAESVNGHSTSPSFTQTVASDHVIHTGTISTEGFQPNGGPDRSLGDFFQIAMDPNHLINIAFSDDHVTPGSAVPVFTRQKQATKGIAGGGGDHHGDGDGDEAGSKGGRAHFHFHEDDCNQQPENETYSDSSTGTNFQSTQVSSTNYDDKSHTLTIVGLGIDNGLPVAFTIVAVDSTLAPPGLFSITLSDGYSNTGKLLDGGISVQ